MVIRYKFEGDGWQFVDDIGFSVDEKVERVEPLEPRAIYLSIVDANNACDQHIAQPGRDDAVVIMNKAVKCGYLSVVGKLIKGRVSPNLVNAENQTPLQLAVKANHLGVVEYLLLHGAEVNREEPGFYQAAPVHRAVLNDHCSMLALLIRYGANCEALTGLGESPLYLAANMRRLDMVSLLLKQNVNCNQYSGRSFGEFVPFSVDYGATALHLAVYHGDCAIVRQLLEHGADVNAKTRGHRETPLIKGVWRQTHGDPIKLILLLLQYPVRAPNPLFLIRHPERHATKDMTPCLMLVNHLLEQKERMKIADILDARFCETASPPLVRPNSLQAIAGQRVWKCLWENKGRQCLFWMYSENEKGVSKLLRLPLAMVRYLRFGQAQADLEG
ncbi:ankyrin repeat domain-containing protein [Kistimonas scapharcae]|uniref:ankyrin repeat domain-containing protein n=1 Tax=Kistimonas scapharcae TaxID=1036133 RepID=UPI0031ED210F